MGSIILESASNMPPALSNDVTNRALCLITNPKDRKNKTTDGNPRSIPLC